MHRIRTYLATLVVVALPAGASATPASVDVLPPNPTVVDSISLETTLAWGTTGYWIFDSMTLSTGPSEWVIQIFVSSLGPDEVGAAIPTDEQHVAVLGLLPAGTYSYTVNEFDVQRVTGDQTLAGSLSGTFTVVPEPSSLALLSFGLVAVAARRRSPPPTRS